VQEHFRRFDLLDDNVRFLKGWFKDTLPSAPIEKLAVMRLDGDMYESTMDALKALYPKLSPGGFVIIDDYGCIPACKKAVEDYRAAHGIVEQIVTIDWSGVYWRKA
jgi:O-methyltransferase